MTYLICCYGIKHCLLRRKKQHTLVYFKNSHENFNTDFGTYNFFLKISKTCTFHACNIIVYVSMEFLPLSFKKEKTNTLLDTLRILMKISTQIFGLRFFSENFLNTHISCIQHVVYVAMV